MTKRTITGYISVDSKGKPMTINEGEDGTVYKQSSVERSCFDFFLTIRHALNPSIKGMTYRKATLTFND